MTNFLETLGTFFSKFYPHKDFVKSLVTIYDTFEKQLLQNLEEINLANILEKCPIEHTEILYPLEIEKQVNLFKVGLEGLVVGNSYEEITKPSIGEVAYEVSSDVLDLPYLKNKIFNPTKIYYKNSDYVFVPGGIKFLVPLEEKLLWGENIKFKSDYVHSTAGFLFFSKEDTNREILQLLLFMMRYGFYKNKLIQFLNIYFGYPVIISETETIISITDEEVTTDKNKYNTKDLPLNVSLGKSYSKLHPITLAVTLEDAKTSQVFIKDQSPVTHEFIYTNPVYGENNWGDFKYDTQSELVDIYFEKLDSQIYVVNILYNKNHLSLKYLRLLNYAKPLWLTLNILIKDTEYEEYSVDTDSTEAKPCKLVSESYSRYEDGESGIITYGEREWGDFVYMQETLNSHIKVFKQVSIT